MMRKTTDCLRVMLAGVCFAAACASAQSDVMLPPQTTPANRVQDLVSQPPAGPVDRLPSLVPTAKPSPAPALEAPARDADAGPATPSSSVSPDVSAVRETSSGIRLETVQDEISVRVMDDDRKPVREGRAVMMPLESGARLPSAWSYFSNGNARLSSPMRGRHAVLVKSPGRATGLFEVTLPSTSRTFDVILPLGSPVEINLVTRPTDFGAEPQFHVEFDFDLRNGPKLDVQRPGVGLLDVVPLSPNRFSVQFAPNTPTVSASVFQDGTLIRRYRGIQFQRLAKPELNLDITDVQQRALALPSAPAQPGGRATPTPAAKVRRSTGPLDDVKVVDISTGQATTLGELRVRKHLLMEVWATWCPACQGSVTKANALAARLGDSSPVRMITLSVDESDAATVLRHVQKKKWNAMDHYWLPDGIGALGRMSPSALPTMLVVEKSGTVTFKGSPLETNLEDLVARIGAAQ